MRGIKEIYSRISSWREADYSKDLWMNILLFYSFAIFGWCWEVMLHLIRDQSFVNRGIMIGPWLPIYGFGGIILYQTLHRLTKAPVLIFLLALIASTVLEYVSGWALEALFGVRWWDYSDHMVHLHGRVCLVGVFLFGIAGLLTVYLAVPVLTRCYRIINPKVRKIICLLISAAFLIDALYSFIHPHMGKGITGAL